MIWKVWQYKNFNLISSDQLCIDIYNHQAHRTTTPFLTKALYSITIFPFTPANSKPRMSLMDVTYATHTQTHQHKKSRWRTHNISILNSSLIICLACNYWLSYFLTSRDSALPNFHLIQTAVPHSWLFLITSCWFLYRIKSFLDLTHMLIIVYDTRVNDTLVKMLPRTWNMIVIN